MSTPAIAVLEALALTPRASRSQLADATGLSAATVGRAVDRLRRHGVLREDLRRSASVGRPPRMVELEEHGASVVSVDAGGRTLRAARADLGGTLRARVARPVRDPDSREALIDDLAAIVAEVSQEAPAGSVQAVVAGISGIIDHGAGVVRLAPDLPGLAGVFLARELEARVGRPVAIDNDDLLAAIGEATAGAAMGCRDVVFLSLGYGLGAGLIEAGRPVRGASHAAGAIAYVAPGRLEDRASGRAIPARYRELAASRDAARSTAKVQREATSRRDGHAPLPADAREVFALAAEGDPIARAVVDDAVEGLGDLLVAVAALLDPEVVVVGGGLTEAGPALFGPLARRLASGVPYPPRLAASVLGDAAVLHGAVSVALVLARRRLAGVEPFQRAAAERSAQALI
jgi:predicted NBD/HSP70 family sugar kinase